MFEVASTNRRLGYRQAIAILLACNVLAFIVTVWVMIDFLQEQETVSAIMRNVPADEIESVSKLAGKLDWQFKLSVPVALNLIATAFAVVLLWRAYHSSQESLRDVKSQASDILNSMDQAIITTNLNGTVISINARGSELLAIEGNPIGRPLNQLSQSIDLGQLCLEIGQPNANAGWSDCSISIAGMPRMLRAFSQPLRSHKNKEIGRILQLRDVTEGTLIEDRMRRMERYMGLGSLVAGLHHEIKNPLAALTLYVQLLEEQMAGCQMGNRVDEMLTIIKMEVGRVNAVLESFRDFASISRLAKTRENLFDLIRRQTTLISPKAERQQVRIELSEQNCDSCIIRIDRVKIEQVILNLFVNALDAMPHSGTLTIGVSLESNHVSVNVSDTGMGIPVAYRDRIFDPYFTTKSQGTGMGLAICEKIVRQHGGALDFRSSSDGTVFVLTLPLDESSAETSVQ